MPAPTNSMNGGVGGIQPGAHDAGFHDVKPKKAKWGVRDLFSFSPKKLHVAKQPSGTRPAQQAYKTIQQYNIRTTQPTVHIRVNSRGSSVTHVHTAQDFRTSRASLKQQASILVDKGLTTQEAESTVKKLSKDSGHSQLAVEEGVAKIPFRNKTRQAWAQWSEQSFLKKGYSPQEARKWAQNLLKEAGTNLKGVEHVVRNTPMTPVAQQAVRIQQQAQLHQMKANDFQWGTNHFVRLGFSPRVAQETVANAQHHYGSDRKGFIDWVRNAPPPQAQPQTPSANDQTKAKFVEQKFKPWALETLQAKGFSKEDATQLLENLLKAPNMKLEGVMGIIQGMAPQETSESGSTSSSGAPRSQSEVDASKEQDRKNLSVLGLQEGVTRAQAKKAYRKLALKLHPDKNTAPDAEAKFKEMESAYKALEKSTTFDEAPLKKEASEKPSDRLSE